MTINPVFRTSGYADEDALFEGNYKEWFWKGMSPGAVAFLKSTVTIPTRFCRMCGKSKPAGDFTTGDVIMKGNRKFPACDVCVKSGRRTNEQPARWINKDGNVRWQDDAACAGEDPDNFQYSENPGGLNQFRQPDAFWRDFCPECPVRQQCEDFARASGSLGVWGGKLFVYSGSNVYDDGEPTTNGKPGRPRKKTA